MYSGKVNGIPLPTVTPDEIKQLCQGLVQVNPTQESSGSMPEDSNHPMKSCLKQQTSRVDELEVDRFDPKPTTFPSPDSSYSEDVSESNYQHIESDKEGELSESSSLYEDAPEKSSMPADMDNVTLPTYHDPVLELLEQACAVLRTHSNSQKTQEGSHTSELLVPNLDATNARPTPASIGAGNTASKRVPNLDTTNDPTAAKSRKAANSSYQPSQALNTDESPVIATEETPLKVDRHSSRSFTWLELYWMFSIIAPWLLAALEWVGLGATIREHIMEFLDLLARAHLNARRNRKYD